MQRIAGRGFSFFPFFIILILSSWGGLAAAAERELLLFEEIPVVTVASKKPQKATDSPLPVVVIGGEEIRRSGASNIPELLRRVAGVDVMAVSASDHNVSIRGFNQQTASRVLVLLDGRPVYLDFYGFVLWDALPVAMEEIGRIEIIKGPGSSMYGGNAFNGVINIITKRPEEIGGAHFALSGGEQGTLSGAALYGRKWGKSALKFSFSRDEYDEWEEWGGKSSYKHSDSAYFMAERGLAGSSSLALSGSIDKSEGETMTSLDNFLREGTQGHLMVDYRGARELNVKLFWNRLDVDIVGESVLPFYEGLGVFNRHEYSIETDTYEAEVTKLFEAGDASSLLLGGNYKRHSIASDMFDGPHHQEIYGLFAEEELKVGPSLGLTAGVRYDHHPLVEGNLSPRLGIVYSPAADHKVRFSYTTAYGLPTFTQSYLYVERNVFPAIKGNEDLDVERIESTNLGYTGLLADRLELNIDLFYNEIDDIIRFPDTSIDDRYRNVDSYTVRGAEIEFRTNVARGLDMRINYTCLDIDYSNRDTGFYESPETKVNAGLDYTSHALFGSLWAHYVGKTRWQAYESSASASFYGYEKVIEAYTIANATLGVNLGKGAALWLHGYNLFNDRHREDPMGDEMGRKILVKMDYAF